MKFDLYKYIVQPLIAEFIKPTLDRYCRARKNNSNSPIQRAIEVVTIEQKFQ